MPDFPLKLELMTIDFQYFVMNTKIIYDKPRVKFLSIFEK